MYADLALENAAIEDVTEPKAVRPSAERKIAEVLVTEHRLPVQRACRVVRLSRAAHYRPPVSASRRDPSVIAALTDVGAVPAVGLLETRRPHAGSKAEG